ncbi:MAG: hypothetical protein H6705_05525 [Myxococcales bacterium]|nr:hypothetical protein [Myxococcales bacterium]
MRRLLPLVVVCLLAAPAAAQEFKLVLTPEGGDGPPARVCLVSRSRTMALEQAPDGIRALADVIRCDDSECVAARELRPARCQVCPETTHDDCRAVVDLGGWRPGDYSVVCADDDTTPPEGGTVYVSVESVEAENPPLIAGFEVSGGRARWSSVDPISRPSYRVLGGDFESSPLSYPRGATDEPWAEVPVRRRCRCLDARTPDIADVQRVLVDGQPVCRGEPGDGLLPVEVPAAGRDAVRSLVVESAAVTGATRWSGRWPASPIPLAPRRFAFTWVMPCEWPRVEVCPSVTIRGVECPVPAPAGDRCHYACRVLGDAVGSPPVEMTLHLDEPGLDLHGILGAAGQTVVGSVPTDQRVVWVDVRRWRRDAVGDRVAAIEVLMLDGTTRTLTLHDRIEDRLTIPLPGARCGISVRTRIAGERDYAPGYGLIERGARLDVPPPEALVVPWDLHVSAGGGMVSTFFTQGARGVSSSVSGTLVGTVGVRARPAQWAWFGEVRAVYLFVGGWPWGPITVDGGSGAATSSETYSALVGELVVGRSLAFGDRTLHVFAGAGAGGSFSVLGASDRVEQGAPMGTVMLGIAWPLGGQYVNRLQPRLDARYWFGSGTLRYSTDFTEPPTRAELDAHALLVTFSIDLRL